MYGISTYVLLVLFFSQNKCVQYWPDVVSGTKEFDCYSVDFLDEIISVDYVTRRFTLRDNANPDKYYTVSRFATQSAANYS